MRRCLLPTLAILFLSLLLPRGAAAKGETEYLTFRISGEDLSHPVTVSLTETTATLFGVGGSWYGSAYLPAPPASAARYRIDRVSLRHPGDPPYESWTYVPSSQVVRVCCNDGSRIWAALAPPIGGLFDRYIELVHRGLVGETPTFAEALQASSQLWPPRVTVDSQELSPAEVRRLLPLLEQIEPVYFGVQAHMLGGRDLHKTELRIEFGIHDLTFAYVPPGPIALYGLLFPPSAVGGWDYIQILDPPGYAQLAYTVPVEFQKEMAGLGFPGGPLQEILSPRVVPLADVVREGGIDHIEVSRSGGAHLVERISPTDVCAAYPNEAPLPSREPSATVTVWWKVMEPFPEAVRPAIYSYYSPAASTGGRGVLVETQQGAVYDSGPGPLQAPCYAAPEVDSLLRGATGHASTSPISIVKTASIVAPLLAVGLTLGFLVLWRRLRSRRSQEAR